MIKYMSNLKSSFLLVNNLNCFFSTASWKTHYKSNVWKCLLYMYNIYRHTVLRDKVNLNNTVANKHIKFYKYLKHFKNHCFRRLTDFHIYLLPINFTLYLIYHYVYPNNIWDRLYVGHYNTDVLVSKMKVKIKSTI